MMAVQDISPELMASHVIATTTSSIPIHHLRNNNNNSQATRMKQQVAAKSLASSLLEQPLSLTGMSSSSKNKNSPMGTPSPPPQQQEQQRSSSPRSRRVIFPTLYRAASTTPENTTLPLLPPTLTAPSGTITPPPTSRKESTMVPTPMVNSKHPSLEDKQVVDRLSSLTTITESTTKQDRLLLDSLLVLSPLVAPPPRAVVATMPSVHHLPIHCKHKKATKKMVGHASSIRIQPMPKPHLSSVQPVPEPVVAPLPKSKRGRVVAPSSNPFPNPSASSSSSASTSSTQNNNNKSSRRAILLLHQEAQHPTPEETFKKPLKNPLLSILRRTKRTPPPSSPQLAKLTTTIPPNDSSVPSLVSLAKDDDELSSQSSTEDTTKFSSSGLIMTSAPSTPPTNHIIHATMTPTCHRNNVRFDPRIWVREFHRSVEEADISWYTVEDLERFKKNAVALIMARCSQDAEIIPTGTGRMVKRSASPACKAFFTHAALRLDGEDSDGSGLSDDAILEREERRKTVLKNELVRVLIVDPHDICLTLFGKALKALIPHIEIETARSSEEAIAHTTSSSSSNSKFDVVLIEERLKLFHRQTATSSSSISSSTTTTTAQQQQQQHSSEKYHHSGSALLRLMASWENSSSTDASASNNNKNTLFIGVSAHLDQDRSSLEKSGADFCWAKPPPRMDQELQNRLLQKILEKRGKTELMKELYGS